MLPGDLFCVRAMRDTLVVSDQDRRSPLRLLDAMDDHYDRRISDQELVSLAAYTRDSLNQSIAYNPGLVAQSARSKNS